VRARSRRPITLAERGSQQDRPNFRPNFNE
jgi:hypothetical protein